MRVWFEVLIFTALAVAGVVSFPVDSVAQVTPTSVPTTAVTSSPTTAPTTFPTSAPVTYATSAPAYFVTYPNVVLGTPPPLHVLTADYWLNSTDQTQFAPYLSYEYPYSASQVAAVKAAGIKAVAYEDWGQPNSTDLEVGLATGTYASAMAHDCAGTVIRTYSGSGYLLDPHASNAPAFLQASISAHAAQWSPDVIFADNWNDLYGASATPCSGTADWAKASGALLGQIAPNAQVIVNTLAVGAPANQVVGIGAADGGEYEHCFTDGAWSTAENAQIAALAAGKAFWCYANGSWSSTDGSAQTAQRLFAYASFLLTYDLRRSLYQTWFKTPSSFRVMPETGFVATQPLASASSSVAELQIGTSTLYVRQFAACYVRAFPIGPCAAVVNASTSAAVGVSLAYGHSVALAGSDVLDGGSVRWDGPQVTQLAPNAGAILTP